MRVRDPRVGEQRRRAAGQLRMRGGTSGLGRRLDGARGRRRWSADPFEELEQAVLELRSRHDLLQEPPLGGAGGIDDHPRRREVQARARPTRSCNRSMPPHAGVIASETWLNAIRTSSAAMRMSHATAVSHPPPKAWPFRPAMTGIGSVAIRSSRQRMRSAISCAPSWVRICASSRRSPPEMKTSEPAPRTASARTSDAATSSTASSSSSMVRRLMALRTSGRSTVSTPASPTRSNRTSLTPTTAPAALSWCTVVSVYYRSTATDRARRSLDVGAHSPSLVAVRRRAGCSPEEARARRNDGSASSRRHGRSSWRKASAAAAHGRSPSAPE